MSNIDQSRAYIELKQVIRKIRMEFGEDAAWNIVEMAVVANLCSIINSSPKKENEHA